MSNTVCPKLFVDENWGVGNFMRNSRYTIFSVLLLNCTAEEENCIFSKTWSS